MPVVAGAGSRLPETYVLQLELEGGASRKIYTVEREVEGQKMQVCYGRYGHTNVKVSHFKFTSNDEGVTRLVSSSDVATGAERQVGL